jgi:molybdate transport system ATP-binding protein
MVNLPDTGGDEMLSVAIARRLPQFSLDIAFRVPAGRVVLFGPSGAGKSLTLQALAGLFPLDQASIRSGSTTWHESATGLFVSPQQRRVGYLPQNYALFPHLSVAQNIAFGQRQKGALAKKRVVELIAQMQLDGLERLRPTQLSGGQQQRVALARALASEPGLLLLDEPWSALDAPIRASLRDELQRFYEQVGVPFVLVTHDAQDAQTLADTVVIIDHGQVLQVGSPEEVFRSPRTSRVAELVGMRTRWRGVVAEIAPASAQGRLVTIKVADMLVQTFAAPTSEVYVGQPVEIGIRPDETVLLSANESASAYGSALTGEQSGVVLSGLVIRELAQGMFYTITLHLSPAMQLAIPLPRWQRRNLSLAAGQAASCFVPCEAVHLFEPSTSSESPA